MVDGPVAMLAGTDDSSRIVYHALLAHGFRVACVVVEEGRRSTVPFLRRRVKRLGVATVAGQVLFRAAVVPLLRATSRERIAEIKRELALDDSPIPEEAITRVPSMNSEQTIRALRRAEPRAVVVNGTRIISGTVLRCVAAPFLNTHAGITPMYRGVHGGYWALVDGDREHCGVTVHLVDEGIDTGNVLGQARIDPTPDDNFVTYPLLQVAAGLPLLVAELRNAIDGRVAPRPYPAGPSRLRTHPTLWQYARHRLIAGVK